MTKAHYKPAKATCHSQIRSDISAKYYYANAGIYLIKRDLLKLIPKDQFFNATDFLELAISKKYKVIRFPLNGTWIDIGNPQEYQKAIELVKHLK